MNNDAMPRIITLSDDCKGPNAKCRKAHRNGQRVHLIIEWDAGVKTLIPTTYHFESIEKGIEQLKREWNDAIMIETDDDLYNARKGGIAHFLPIGWIDPEMRR